MFGWDWDFEIMDEKILIDAKEVVVKGKLTCRSNGKTIVKMQFGNKDIMFRKGTDIPLSVGNDLKAASTDALKKCASEIGIAADIYNKEDFREVKVNTEDYTVDRLKQLFYNLSDEVIAPEDAINIERIIDQEDSSCYQKAITLIINSKK
jgi:hypothetical protein